MVSIPANAVLNTPRQGALDIQEPTHYHTTGWGFFSLLARNESGHLAQSSYRLDHLPAVIKAAPRDRDCYISQGEFMRPNRRVVNLARVGLMFVDIDPIGAEHLDGDQWAMRCLMACQDEGIPAPSLIVFSGRGVHLKWVLTSPVTRKAIPRWNHAQSQLVERLAHLGADRAAKDASRVLRLEGTRNSKTGEVCQVVWEDRDLGGELVRYNFDELFDELAEMPRHEYEALVEARRQEQERRRRRASLKVIKGGRHGLRRLGDRQLAWDRLEDLRKLAELRADSIEGARMLFLFWCTNFLMLAAPIKVGHLHYEARSLAAEIAPGWSYQDSELGTVYRKAKAYAAGERVEFQGRSYAPLYTPANATLIDRFGITDDEQRQMGTIISKAEAARRHRAREEARRRAAGAVERGEYLENMASLTEQRRQAALAMRSEGKTNREIAEAMGIHAKSVPRLLRG